MALGSAGETVVVFFRTNMGDAEAILTAGGWRDITSNEMLVNRYTVLDAAKVPYCWWSEIGGPGAADNMVADPVACFGHKLT